MIQNFVKDLYAFNCELQWRKLKLYFSFDIRNFSIFAVAFGDQLSANIEEYLYFSICITVICLLG